MKHKDTKYIQKQESLQYIGVELNTGHSKGCVAPTSLVADALVAIKIPYIHQGSSSQS